MIGITYDLRSEYLAMGYSEEETAEFDREETIQSLESTLNELGYETERIGNIFNLVKQLNSGKRWDLVFNIAEGINGLGREALIPALLDAYGIPYTFSDPLVLSVSLHKATAKQIVRSLGIPTPDFHVVRDENDMESVDLGFPLFVKPIAEGTSKGIDDKSIVSSREELFEICLKYLDRYRQPVLVETFLSGREFTVGIIGTGSEAYSAGILEVLLRDSARDRVYSYWNKELCENMVDYRLADDADAKQAENIALKIWSALGCRDAGRVDFKADGSGKVHFLEINPLAGLHPTHSDLPIICNMAGVAYEQLIGCIMNSALSRNKREKCCSVMPDIN